ncbi:hypothetical protein [Arthrobacter sp. UM1]|uniref:hypothetical protein n=1 Tax=Arthrobacter sp. UM1 TaxID=2766776 RepID=UPI001CF70708|nr:hypothetical protein [Arthrobacter sp. UM1]MCB4207319.1 hypothetical protein [Arthrobacter sp. UM1]
MAAFLDTVFALVFTDGGEVWAARLADAPESEPWSLPAGPSGPEGPRAMAEHWCERLTGRRGTAGELLAVRFDGERTAFAFEVFPEDSAESGPVEAGPAEGVVARSYRPDELEGLLGGFERGVLTASLRALESARVVEWNDGGERRARRVPSWTRMMPTLPVPFGPKPLQAPGRASRNRTGRSR